MNEGGAGRAREGSATLAQDQPEQPSARSFIDRPTVLLVAVTLLYLVLQLVAMSLDRFVEYDEAVYVSQVTPDHPAFAFDPHRARGIVWLVAPVVQTFGVGTALRLYLAIVLTAGLFLGFRAWTPTIRNAAAVAAALFATSWLVIFYGSAVYPNLPSALLCVGAVGIFARGRPARLRTRWLLLAALLALVALFRPLDAAALSLGLIVVGLIRDGLSRRTALELTCAPIGSLVGLIPWLVDSGAYGGPIEALKTSSRSTASGLTFMGVEYLKLSDGPFYGPDPGPIPVAGLLWLVGLVVFSMIGIVRERHTRTSPFVCAAITGTVLASPYVFYTGVSSPRFLLPGLALLAIPAAWGLMATFERAARPAVAVAALLLLAVAWFNFHVDTARYMNSARVAHGLLAQEIGAVLKSEGGARCAFAAPPGLPCGCPVCTCVLVEFASGCDSYPLDRRRVRNRMLNLRKAGYRVFAISQEPRLEGRLSGWTRTPMDLESGTGWFLYQPPAQHRSIYSVRSDGPP